MIEAVANIINMSKSPACRKETSINIAGGKQPNNKEYAKLLFLTDPCIKINMI